MFTRKSALQHLLGSMGIEIDPAELMEKYEQAKNIMPQLAGFVQTLDGRLNRIEEMLGVLAQNQLVSKPQEVLNGNRTDTGTA